VYGRESYRLSWSRQPKWSNFMLKGFIKREELDGGGFGLYLAEKKLIRICLYFLESIDFFIFLVILRCFEADKWFIEDFIMVLKFFHIKNNFEIVFSEFKKWILIFESPKVIEKCYNRRHITHHCRKPIAWFFFLEKKKEEVDTPSDPMQKIYKKCMLEFLYSGQAYGLEPINAQPFFFFFLSLIVSI